MNRRSGAVAALVFCCLTAASAWGQEEGSEASPSLVPVSGIIIFYNSQGPLSFVTDTHRDAPKGAAILGEVKARDCQHGVSIPLSFSLRATSVSAGAGNGGYRKALQQIAKEHPELAGIFDVKVDIQTFSILGIYRRTCTEISARGFKKPTRNLAVGRPKNP